MLKAEWFKKTLISVLVAVLVVVIVFGSMHLGQHVFAHIEDPFYPDYKRVTLTENSDYETIFLQTGLGESAAKKLIEEGRFNEILEAQEYFFTKDEVVCEPLIEGFTLEERLKNKMIPFYDLQPGDILVTLSTHSMGWRHGHAAIVIDSYTTVESVSMGTNSSIGYTSFWQNYSNFAVLRVKGATTEERQKVADYTYDYLVDKPYSIFAGFGLNKAPKHDSEGFSLHCSYLAWYAWNHAGYDLDSDGGAIATSSDLLYSDKVEIVQIYGIDPRKFIK